MTPKKAAPPFGRAAFGIAWRIYCFGAVVAGGVVGAGEVGGALRSTAGWLAAVCWLVVGAKAISPAMITTIASKASGTPHPEPSPIMAPRSR